jgi:hypothetical protein
MVETSLPRPTYKTNLAHAGIDPKAAQTLARHSDMKLTMKRYTKFEGSEIVAGLDKLPKLSGQGPARHIFNFLAR